MTWNPGLTELQDVLADLYITVQDSRKVVEDAGLKPTFIEFDNKATNNWQNILREADRRDKVQAIIKVARRDYSEKSEELAQAERAYLQWVESQSGVATAELLRSAPRKYVPPDPDLTIGQEIHWDRNLVVETFVGMIKNSPKHPWRILGIQGPEHAGIDSLIDRLERMCKEATTPRPLLYARILLRGVSSSQDFALKTLTALDYCAADAKHQVARSQGATLTRGCDAIDQSTVSEPGLGGQRVSPSPYQVARHLTGCLREVTRECAVVLLLQGFEDVRNSKIGEWLRDVWLTDHACRVQGLAVVIAGATGLHNLTGLQSQRIYCIDSLQSMKWQDFADWAREGCKISWFTDDMAIAVHGELKGSVSGFATFLVGAKPLGPHLLKVLVAQAQDTLASPQ